MTNPADSARLLASVCASLACIVEVTCRKPGNVHSGASFADCDYRHFLYSAAAIQPAMGRARELGVGRTVLEGVRLTRRVVGCNTNLGILLLLAPLVIAAQEAEAESSDANRELGELRQRVGGVLSALDNGDARAVYEAIRAAHPGGLGELVKHDVSGGPDISLREAMGLASERDLVARQYVNDFEQVFEHVFPILSEAMGLHVRDSGFAGVETAVVAAHLHVMAGHPDSLIGRKCGSSVAEEASRRAAAVLASGWPEHPEGQAALESLDSWLRADGNRRNPGTTADLVTAGLFLTLWLEGHPLLILRRIAPILR